MIIFVVVLVLVGGGLYLNNQQPSQTELTKIITGTETPVQELTEKKNTVTNSSRYVEYSKEAYNQAANKRRVLYFYATWCPSCKVANEDFLANPGKIPEDVVVIRTNYNDPNTDADEKNLAKKYSIIYQHTFVQIDAQGNELAKWNGGETDELVTNIK